MKPILFIICGQVGAGKTTAAHILSNVIRAQVASVDATVKRLFANASFEGKDTPPSPEELEVCYNAFALIAEYTLNAGSAIIIDGAFALRKQRELLISIAERLSVPYYILNIICPDDLLEKRANERFAKGEGVGFQAHLQIKKIYEPLEEKHHTIDTSLDVKEQLQKFLVTNNIK